MIKKSGSTIIFFALLLIIVGVLPAHGDYPTTIQYKQTMVKVADESNPFFQTWGGTERRYFRDIVVSADGTKVGFVVKLNLPADRHIYVMNADGSSLVDLTANVPPGTSASDIVNLQINDNGSRLFFRDYSLGNIYCFNTASGTSQTAFPGADGVDNRKPYTLDSDGSRLYFQHRWFLDGAWHEGLCYADVGSNTAVPVFDVQQLSPPGGNYGFRYLGASRSGATMLFTYYPDSSTNNQWAMYKTGTGTPTTRVPDETHTWVWGETYLPDNIVSTDGGRALYTCQDSGGNEHLYYVNVANGAKTVIAPDSGNVTFPAMSPNGADARFSGAGHYHTRVNLDTLKKRDTGSYWFGEAAAIGNSNLTDLTADNRYYFLGSGPVDSTSRIHRIDMAPSGSTAPAPDITAISLGKRQLVFEDTTPVTLSVRVNDNGSGSIQAVDMHTLVDGLEFPSGLNQEPLNYSNPLTNAGGGIYTTTISANTFSNFYTSHAKPWKVGVRVVVKNSNDHYVMADTEITVTTRGSLNCPGVWSLLLLD